MALEAHIPRLKAKDILRQYRFSDKKPTAELLFDLVLQATESEEMAREEMHAYAKAMLRNNEDPA